MKQATIFVLISSACLLTSLYVFIAVAKKRFDPAKFMRDSVLGMLAAAGIAINGIFIVLKVFP